MATKRELKAAQDRIFARPRPESKSDQELLRKTEDDGVYPSPLNVKAVRVDRIVPDASRPRRTDSDAALDDLGQSLLIHGQIIPILVHYQSDEDVFVIVDGERRWRAAQDVGLQTLQAIILGSLTVVQRDEQRIIAALHQKAWDEDECVQALEMYKAQRGLSTWTDVAHRLGLSEAGLQTMLGAPAAPGDDTAPDSDPLSQAAAATRLLEHALSRVRPGQGYDSDATQLLDQLGEYVIAQRARLERARSKAQVEDKSQPSEGAAKPVRHMPPWGQR